MVRVLIMGSREASPAMLAKVEEVVLCKPRQSFRYVFGLISRPDRIIVTL